MSVLHLIRFPNQLIIFLTQYILYYGLILPVLSDNHIEPNLEKGHFYFMFAITSLVSISGYIINDLLDLRTDLINKKKKMVIGKKLSVRTAKFLYLFVIVLGFVMSLWMAIYYDSIRYLYIYPTFVALLAFYSYRLKGSVFFGNLLVAIFSASVAAIVTLFERKAIIALYQRSPEDANLLFSILYAFIIFAFLSSLYREIVKDIEDVKGDARQGLNTIAVRFGVKKARISAMATGILLALSLGTWTLLWPNTMHLSFQIFGSLVMGLVILSLILFYRARTKDEIHKISQWIKAIMFSGLLYLLLYVYIL